MRIKHFFGLAVIAAMTASCSSNNDSIVGGGNGSGENESGVSYASFSINLPTTNGTRATDPSFDKGDANEYDVNDVTLLVFKKGTDATSEGAYTFVEYVDLGSMAPWKNPNETGVTTHSKITAKLEKVDKNGDFFALVLLNNGKDANAKVTLPHDGDKFSTWNAATNATAKFASTDKGFYMANAPLFDNTKKQVTTLVAIDKDKIYPTESQASASAAAADIYVERGLAKVTLGTGTGTEKTVADGTYANDKVTIKNWALDVTNKKTFPIHNVEGLATKTEYEDIWKNTTTASPTNGATNQRFVDNKPETFVKRVYWGIDPNYKDAKLNAETEQGNTDRKAEFNYVAKDKLTAELGTPLYCLENTFNLDNMMQGQTTRVIFKAKYTPYGFSENTNFYKIGKNVQLWKQDDLKKHIKAAVTNVVASATDANTTITLAGSDNDLTKAGNRILKASNITVTDYTLQPADVKAINVKLGLSEGNGISTYESGESYYIARIKHFGDVLTPWKAGNSYGTDNLAYLGRYGVLRNNWYELDVQSVSGPGYPDVPDVKPNTQDDENDMYINVSVKILSWAKRSQKVDL